MTNYLTYPTKILNITQTYSNAYSHAPHSTGLPADYPIDEACGNNGRSYFYCPCNEIEIKHIYGVGNSGTNTIWLQSTSKVVMPCGEDYVTILVTHPEDDDLSKLSVGQKFVRGQQMFKEGKDGNANGYHFHMAVGAGKFTSPGWVKNSKGSWVNKTTGRQLKPEEAFFVDISFTKIKRTSGLNFQKITELVLNYYDNNNNNNNNNTETTPKIEPSVPKVLTLEKINFNSGLHGINLGYNVSSINADAIKNSYKFALLNINIKNTSDTLILQQDGLFTSKYNSLHNKIPIGLCWDSVALTNEEINQEYSYLINLIGGKKIEYPIYIRLSKNKRQFNNNDLKMSWNNFGQLYNYFCENLKTFGCYPGILADSDFYSNTDFFNQIKNYSIGCILKDTNSTVDWNKWTTSFLQRNLQVNKVNLSIDKIHIWECGQTEISNTLTPVYLSSINNFPDYIKQEKLNNQSSNSSITNLDSNENNLYYIREADTIRNINIFNSYNQAVNYIKTEKENGKEYYIYDENNFVIYPKNINQYYLSYSFDSTKTDQIIGSFIKIENALFQGLAQEFLLRNKINNNKYYIINDKNQVVCGIGTSYYILATAADNFNIDTAITNQIASYYNINTLQNMWLSDKNKANLAIYEINVSTIISQRNEINDKTTLKNRVSYKKMVPYDYKYLLIPVTEDLKNNAVLYNKISNILTDSNFSTVNKPQLYKTNNINLAKKSLKYLGYLYHIYDIENCEIIASIDINHFSLGDIVGILGDLTNQYTITNINDDIITLNSNIQKNRQELYPINQQVQANGTIYYVNVAALTNLTDNDQNHTPLIKVFGDELTITDVNINDGILFYVDNKGNLIERKYLTKKES